MPEDVNGGTVKVAFKGDLEGLLAGIEKTKTEVKSFVPAMKEQFMDLGKGIAAAFTIREMVRFSQEAVQRFAVVQKSQYLLSQQIRNTKGDFKALTASAIEYAEAAGRAFEVDNVEVMDSLRQLTTITGDLHAAMGLNTLAMKVSKTTGDTLADSSYKLGLAFQGDEKATKALGKEFGVMGEKGKDIKTVLEAIEKKTVELDPKVKLFSQTWHDFGTVLDDEKTTLGELISGPLQKLLDMVTRGHRFQKDLNDALKDEVYIRRKAAIEAQFIKEQGFKGELTARALRDQRMQHLVDDFRVEQAQAAKKKELDADALAALAIKNQKEREAADEKKRLADEEIHTSKEVRDKAHAAGTERIQFMDEIGKKQITAFDLFKGLSDKEIDTTRHKGEYFADWKIRIEKDITHMTEVAKEKAAKLAEFSKSISDTISSDFQAFVGNIRAGNATLMDSFAVLGKAILKSMVNALGETLIQKGAADIIEGLADLLNPATYALAPGFLASGAYKSAGGGAMKGVAAGLAFGGGAKLPAWRPFAEKEPEVAVPLSKLKTDSTFGPALAHAAGMGGAGVTIGTVKVEVNGVRDFSNFSGAGTRQTIARSIAQAIDQSKYRQGRRRK